jgi:hypothetical protein
LSIVVRIVLQLRERALVVLVDAGGQVALGQRGHHAHHVVDAGAGRRHQLVQAIAHLLLEALHAGGVDARLEVAAVGGFHHGALAGDHQAQLVHHLADGEQHAARVALAGAYLAGQVAVRNALEQLGRVGRFAAQRARQAQGDPEGHADAHQHGRHAQHDQLVANLGVFGGGGLAGLFHQRVLVGDQLFDRPDVGDLLPFDLVHQQLARFDGLAFAGETDELFLTAQVFLAFFDDGGEQLLALFGANALFQLAHAVARILARLFDARQFAAGGVGAAGYHDIAHGDRNTVNVTDQVVGEDDLRIFIADHFVDVVLDIGQAADAQQDDGGQQQADDAEAQGQAGTDFQVTEHRVLRIG